MYCTTLVENASSTMNKNAGHRGR